MSVRALMHTFKKCWTVGALSAIMSGLSAGAPTTFSGPATAHEGHAHPAPAQEEGHAHDPTNIWAIARGGQLYDKWWAVIEAEPPKETHPAYPAAGKKKGASTWRCKECHGWDYKGKDGAYAKGSHATGIEVVRGVVGMDPEKTHAIKVWRMTFSGSGSIWI